MELCAWGGFVEVVCRSVLPPLGRLSRVLSPNRASSAVLPQSLAGIKGPSFLKGKQRSLCDHLLSPFFLCSSLRRQGAICPWTKERCPSSSRPEVSIYKSSLPCLSPCILHHFEECQPRWQISSPALSLWETSSFSRRQRQSCCSKGPQQCFTLPPSGHCFHFISALQLSSLALCFTILTLYHH